MPDQVFSAAPESSSAPQWPAPKPGLSLTVKIILLVVGILVVAGVSTATTYLILSQTESAPSVNNNQPFENANQNGNEATLPEGQKPDDTISWQGPQAIDSLKLFQESDPANPNYFSREATAKYYKVGEVKAGEYTGAEIILVQANYEGPALYPAFYRFLKKDGALILLKKHSDAVSEGDGLLTEKFSIDQNYHIASLDFPEEISGPAARQVLTLDTNVQTFFDLNGVKKVFTDPSLGDVYTTSGYPSEYVSTFDRHGFYLMAPDGTAKVYTLKIDFFKNGASYPALPEINWSDGAVNKDNYNFQDIEGCGATAYVSVVSPDAINRSTDLEVIGHNSKGDEILGLKDGNHRLLKDLYENKYAVPAGEKKMSYAEFLATRPIFFWLDPFNRLIKFQNTRFAPLAECGKPVIYLYPEETQKVSVKVAPKGGLSYSDPAYDGGWLVEADPQGHLKNLVDGKTYPYLFWEGRGQIYQTPEAGFVIKQSEVESFLRDKLARLGLNEKETADFMEFWVPKMTGAPYFFVTFLGNREMDQLAPLTISPKPDTVIRVLMDFTPLEAPISVRGFGIKTPPRKGFTVVEWGGVLR